jgi:hypothetical protein
MKRIRELVPRRRSFGGTLAARCALLAALAAAACTPAHQDAARTSPQTARAEMRDVDAALRRVPHGNLVDSYHIDGDDLAVYVDGAAWRQLGAAQQDAFKRPLWQAWSASVHRLGTPPDRIFVTIYDMGGVDLGSAFE